MQLRYGSYSFDANSLTVGSNSETMLSPARIPYARRTTLQVHGWLLGDSQSDLTTKQAQMEAAFAIQNQTLALYQDSGALSATYLTPSGSTSGVIITRPPSFPGNAGNEYATQREFTFEAYAEYPIVNSATLTLSFKESVAIWGGGPLYIMRRAINGPPQRQLVYPQIEYEATQSGEAVGYLAYPAPAPPIWPGNLKQAGRITRIGPDRYGQSYQNYTVRWDYEYHSVGALVGVPRLWT